MLAGWSAVYTFGQKRFPQLHELQDLLVPKPSKRRKRAQSPKAIAFAFECWVAANGGAKRKDGADG